MDKMTPKALGFRFPAEWEKHESTWLTYPKQNESWPDNFEKVILEYNLFVKAIASREIVHLNVDDKSAQMKVSEVLDKTGCNMENIFFHLFYSDDCWCRDHGAVFLINDKGERAIIDWEFNAWGGKYPFENDNLIASKIASYLNIKVFKPGIVMEGGSAELNGDGTLITSYSCLLNNNRNPGLSKPEIEKYLCDYFCVDQILWLEDGITGDDTDGHIDDVARFSDRDTIIMAIEFDKNKKDYLPLKKNLEIAKKFRLNNGGQPTIVEIPMPDPQYLLNFQLPASYANFYICNAGVIVPVFNCKQDQVAIDILSKAFLLKKIIPLNSKRIIHGLGSWHCLSQQEPMIKRV
jgi:agmatine deiminase